MVIPNLELLSLGGLALCLGTVLAFKDQGNKYIVKCKKCGEKTTRARNGHIVCKNGHRITFDQ